MLKEFYELVHSKNPLIHNITNYVTVHDVANAQIACGAAPIMSDEPEEAFELNGICDGLLLNIGTLNMRSIGAMNIAGKQANFMKHPIILDPVGCGATTLRTNTARGFFGSMSIACVRGNASEIRALSGAGNKTRGVDVDSVDIVTEKNLMEQVVALQRVALRLKTTVVMTGAIDLITDGRVTYVVRNGHPMMADITGSGCMLSGVVAAYVAAAPRQIVKSVAVACVMFGIAGELAADRCIKDGKGNATYSNYLIDEIYTMDLDKLTSMAQIEEL